MSATQTAITAAQTHPGDLNANELITYDTFGWLLPDGLNRRKFERLSRLGNAPAGVRYTKRSKMVWKAGVIAAWLKAKDDAMDAPAEVVAETALWPTPAEAEALVTARKSRREAGQ